MKVYSVRSAGSRGSTAAVVAPVPAPTSRTRSRPFSGSAAPARAASVPPGGGLGLRVLLVEDNPVNQRLTQKLLENFGCDWDLAEDGPLALARLSRGTYDLVLLDLYVPEIDGRAFVEQIRRGGAGEGSRNIWIIAFTAADTPESERRQIMAGGVNDCLAKPIRPANLEAALRRAMGYTPPRA